MTEEEKKLREEYFDGPASDQMSLDQFLLSKGFDPKNKGVESKKFGGGLARRKRSIARGCGKVMEGRRKQTLYT